jgi:hypothetical protein
MSFYEELVKSIPIWQEAEYDLCKNNHILYDYFFCILYITLKLY